MRLNKDYTIPLILLLFALSLVFNINGEKWDGIFHTSYQIFFLCGISLLLVVFQLQKIVVNRLDVVISIFFVFILANHFLRCDVIDPFFENLKKRLVS